MNEKIIQRMKLREEQFQKKLENLFFRDALPLKAEFRKSTLPVPYAERQNGEFHPIQPGERFGNRMENAWFHVTGTIPEAWRGRRVALRLNFGGETLVYDESGVPLTGLTSSSVFFKKYVKEYLFLDSPYPERIDLWCETVAMTLVGQAEGSGTGICSHLEIGWIDDDLWKLKWEFQLVKELAGLAPGARSHRAVMALDESITLFNGDAANAHLAREPLKRILSLHADDGEWTTCAVGHAHLDVGWLWPVSESIRKATRTFASQIRNLEQYPGYIFGASQAQLYAFVKEYAPELFRKIQKKVAEKRWEVQGGMWVEADCNLSSGESLIRQFLHGKNFFKDEFGVDVKNMWLPDVFGYSAALPQIIRKSGCDSFLTQKISWNQINTFPYHSFRWRGIDGTEVLTHFPPENTYNSWLRAGSLATARDRYNESAAVPEFMTLFGMGDGGGGPKEDHLEIAVRSESLPGVPRVKFGRADEFFARLETVADRLPEWSGELYLEMHRGTYTTQSRTKRNNRRCEQMFAQIEALWSCLPYEEYPSAELDRMWKSLLCKQFHDILPGSSITEVYEITEREHAQLLSDGEKLIEHAAEKLFKPEKESLTVFNFLSYPYSIPVELPPDWCGHQVLDADGNSIPVQTEHDKCWGLCDFPADSFTVLRKGASLSNQANPKSESLVLENELIRYEFNADGQLLSAFDKTLQTEVIADGVGNLLNCYRDDSLMFDVWDIENYYRNGKPVPARGISAKRLADGPVRQVLEFELKIGENSTIRQQVVLTANSKRLDFISEADWHEAHRMLRVSFPLAYHADEACCDIQYGYVKRPTHTNTSWDAARFEVCAHRYVDISEGDRGAALLNDCKYGWHLERNLLDLALMRSPHAPQLPDGGIDHEPEEITDQGLHSFTYSFLPHEKTLVDSGVIAEAACLNRKPLIFSGIPENEFPIRLVEGSGVSLEVVKKAEKEDVIVIRLVETDGTHSAATLSVHGSALRETDLMEWGQGEIYSVVNERITLKFHPFEIRTFKVMI